MTKKAERYELKAIVRRRPEYNIGIPLAIELAVKRRSIIKNKIRDRLHKLYKTIVDIFF